MPLGFKLGYQLDESTFYSWLGGVFTAARSQGVATKLLSEHKVWVRQRGYALLRVKTRNRFPAMLRLLIRHGYVIEGLEAAEDVMENRILLHKKFLPGS